MRLDHLLSKEEEVKFLKCVSLSGYQYPGREITKYLAAIRVRATPVPIPNTTVKTHTADGTALETVWQSRWLPELKGL